MKLQVLIPLYNEADCFYESFKVIDKVLKNDGFEPTFILVDDGSKDATWELIKRLKAEFKNIRAVRFARNFGKEIALMAGVNACDDALTVVMDGDLQHPPKYIKAMYDKMLASSADIVEGYKSNRGKESLLYKIFAKSFYKVLRLVSGVDMDNSSDFKLMTGDVIKNIKNFDERNIFFRGIVDYVGFEREHIDFEVEDRLAGTSSFSMKKLSMLALDAVVSYTGKLLYMVFVASVVFMLFSLIMIVQTLYNYFSGIAVSGFSTVIIILLLSASVIMMSLGIIGVYLSRIYNEVKGRPVYVIKEEIND